MYTYKEKYTLDFSKIEHRGEFRQIYGTPPKIGAILKTVFKGQ